MVGVIAFLALISQVPVEASSAPKEVRKHTTVGKDLTSSEAYEMWKANPDKVKVLDVRTPEEYISVGHPPMAYNVPLLVFGEKSNPGEKAAGLQANPDFEAKVKRLFASDDTILVICRVGNRSAAAVNKLAKAGFTDLYNIVDGFEGEKIADADMRGKGKRVKTGWKNSSAPWTYDLDPKLVYAPTK